MKLWGGRFETGPSEVFERFSGSLYFLVLADSTALVLLTPVGGVSFLGGWVMLALAALKGPSS